MHSHDRKITQVEHDGSPGSRHGMLNATLVERGASVGGGVWSGRSARVVGGTDLLQAGLHAPDLPRILRDGAVAGELPTASDVVDHLPGPLAGVLPEQGHRQGSLTLARLLLVCLCILIYQKCLYILN